MDTIEQVHDSPRPYRPVAQQPARDAHGMLAETEWCEQVDHDAVVIAGIERDLAGTARLRQRAHHVERLVAVERCHFDGHDIFDLDELAPEFIGQNAPAHGGLQIETKQRDHGGNGACVDDQLVHTGIAQRAEAQQAGVIPAASGAFRFLHGLRRGTDDTGHADGFSLPQFFHGQRKHRFEQAHMRIADFELRGVNPYRHPPSARGQIIACERALPPFVQLAIGLERQRMRGNRHAAPQLFAPDLFADISHQKRPSRVSKCVGLESVAPPIPIHSATHSIICSTVTDG